MLGILRGEAELCFAEFTSAVPPLDLQPRLQTILMREANATGTLARFV